MGQKYSQLCLEERCSIAQRFNAGQSYQEIATALDREPSTIWREVNRNGGKKIGYKPSYAHEQANARRWRGSRLARQPELQKHVLDRLAMGWSPAQIAGRLAHEKSSTRISHESIYRFIYAEMRRTDDGRWRHYLRQAKSRRGRRSRPSASPVHTVENRVPLAKRPATAENRKQAGHWEADLMLFRTYRHNVLTVHERKSRFTVLLRQANKTSETTRRSLSRFFARIPEALQRSLTFDNGTEFALHHKLDIPTYFCEPHSPWQKGGIENAIGRLRSMLPTKTNISELTSKQIRLCATIYNHTPRECLDFQTPAEVFYKQLLHFKCDSTRWPKAG
jgi:IS30 family transposase